MSMDVLITSDSNGQLVTSDSRMLTAAEFHQLSDVPASQEWFANIINEHTRDAYEDDVQAFFAFVGITNHDDLRLVTRAHVIAWRKQLEIEHYAPATIRRKLSALSSLFTYLCECNAVTINPTHGVKRPKAQQSKGKTPSLSPVQARMMVNAIDGDSLLAKRDRAILLTFLHHGIRRDELCKLKVKDMQSDSGYLYLIIQGKGSKIRYVILHSEAKEAIIDYLEMAGHKDEVSSPLFRPTRNNHTKTLDKHLDPNTVYRIIKKYGKLSGLSDEVIGLTTHSTRASSATFALNNGSSLKQVKHWLGHENIATTTLYDHTESRPEDSPTFRTKF